MRPWPSSAVSMTRVAPALPLAVVVCLAAYLALPRLLDREIAFYDEGVYVATAKALAAGSGYRNPSLPDAPPQAKYPPLVPLALSLVWRLAPLHPDRAVPGHRSLRGRAQPVPRRPVRRRGSWC